MLAVLGSKKRNLDHLINSVLILTGEILICLSPQLLQEYEEVSQRERFAKNTQTSQKWQSN